jgi:ATP-dependent helicase YprA (DUF1998 family)
MTEINPLHFASELEDTIGRYLQAALPISPRFPELRAAFDSELRQRERLLKGPFVESLPDFMKGRSLRDLASGAGALLHPDFARLDESIFTRLLHRHQDEALATVVGEKRNAVVATGTGSGKTECFLYPILDALLKEPEEERRKAGVRAVLIYPLNALANDQLYKRIVPMFSQYYADKGIRVGRYTGLTRRGVSRDNEVQQILADPFFRSPPPEGLGWNDVPANWLLTRDEMLETPPHVLITNYAMLEHLLLFPRNERLFRDCRLRFVVLDEVHTYGGAQATEVAFLLRKLMRRVGASPESVRCLGTSASFAKGEEADQKICEFASKLFGAPFSRVIRGAREKHHLLQRNPEQPFSLPAVAWASLGRALGGGEKSAAVVVADWNASLDEAGIEAELKNRLRLASAETVSQSLAETFAQAVEMRRGSELLATRGTIPFSQMALELFDDSDAEDALTGLVNIGIRARRSASEY